MKISQSEYRTRLLSRKQGGRVMYKQLCICDVDPVYLKRLAAYLSRKPEVSWRIKTYTELEICLRERPEILIISGAALSQWQKKKGVTKEPEVLGCKLIFLRDETSFTCQWPSVKKYQAAGKFFEDLLVILAEDMFLETEVVGIYGPSDGPGAEIIAQEIGRKCLEKGEVLIISLVEYSMILKDSSYGNGIGDWFYYYTQQMKEKTRLSAWAYTEDRMNYLHGFRTIYDQRGISLNDWQIFFKEGMRKSPYRTVLLVFDRIPDYLELFLWCDVMYVQWGRDNHGNLRKKQFEEMATYMEMTEMMKHFIEL